MDDQAVSRPYAEAAYKHAERAGSAATAEWEKMLYGLAELVDTNPMRQLIADPRFTPEQRSEAMRTLLDTTIGSGQDQFTSFCQQLLANGRLAAASAIADRFAQLRREAESIVDVEIRTAFELSEAQVGNISNALKSKLDCKQVQTSVVLDNTLGGGVRITAGDDVIDATVNAELSRLRSAVLRA